MKRGRFRNVFYNAVLGVCGRKSVLALGMDSSPSRSKSDFTTRRNHGLSPFAFQVCLYDAKEPLTIAVRVLSLPLQREGASAHYGSCSKSSFTARGNICLLRFGL